MTTTFFKEVSEQPEAIRQTVRQNEFSYLKPSKPLLLTGMGSSLAASELLVSYLNHHGIESTAMDNSELLHYFSPDLLANYSVMITSQSGESYEAKLLSEICPEAFAITNTPTSSLAEKSRIVYYTHAGVENAIASSKSFTTTAALMLLLGSKLTGEDLSQKLMGAADVIESNLLKAEDFKQQIANFIDPEKPLVLLGRGPNISTARQGALTLKETARMFVEGVGASQFRHGPFELIKENLQAIFFNPKGVSFERNQEYVVEMANLGAKILYVSDEPLEHENVESIILPSVHEFVSPIPYSLVIQLAAIVLSEKRGLVAGESEIITKVTGKE